MARLTALVAVLFYHSLVSATATFSPNCTLPQESTSYVASPNTRGTLDILWSGLFTIFICIWTVQHLNVPEQRDGRDPGWQGNVKWALKAFWTKFKWMLLTLILPEMPLAKALDDLLAAREALTRGRNLKEKRRGPLSAQEISKYWTLTHAYYANMGGFAFRTSALRPDGKDYQLQYITANDVLKLRAQGHIAKLPSISEHEIQDKSKGDFIVKATAVIQVSWLVIQVIVRAKRNLPISQLEITACAFAACTFLTYGILWSKPQAVTSCTMIELESTDVEAEATLGDCWEDTHSMITMFWLWIERPHMSGSRRRDRPVRNDLTFSDDRWYYGGLTIGCIFLGALHCGAWNLPFPTRPELLLWRYISITSCAILPVSIGLIWVIDALFSGWSYRYSWLYSYVHLGMIILYIGCRLYLLFESIYSLFYLPPGAYITTWASNIPHIG
ncbi:hypothetical protein DL98DRAFT_584848 [Cadophora sp. DSE1049]|nr:hypothetical protein DL98DRAFT_584848 [Cadophora sp. DSE1049]